MKRSKSAIIGYTLMAISSLITVGVLVMIGFPLIPALLFSGISLWMFFMALNNPRQVSEGVMGASGLILVLLVLFYFVPWDIARSFKLLMIALATLYFSGSIMVYFSRIEMGGESTNQCHPNKRDTVS